MDSDSVCVCAYTISLAAAAYSDCYINIWITEETPQFLSLASCAANTDVTCYDAGIEISVVVVVVLVVVVVFIQSCGHKTKKHKTW